MVIRRDGGGLQFFDIDAPNKPPVDLAMKGHMVSNLVTTPDGRFLVTIARPSPGISDRPGSGGERPGDRQGPRGEWDEPRLFLWDRQHPEAPKATLTLPASKLEQPYARGGLSLAIAPDGSRIAAARRGEQEVTLWDGDGTPLPPTDARGSIQRLALGPAGLLAASLDGGEVALWDLSTSKPKLLPGLNLHQGFVYSLKFNPRDGSILAAAGSGGIELWDLTTHTLLAALPVRGGGDMNFSPDGRTLAVGQGSSIALWSVVEPTALDVLPETGDLTISLAFDPGNVLAIAAASRDANMNWNPVALRLWGGPGMCPPQIKAWDPVRPSAISFDDQGRLLALESEGLRWYQPQSSEAAAKVDLPRSGPQRKSEGNPSNRPSSTSVVARSPNGRALILARQDFGRPEAGRQESLLLWRADDPKTFSRVDRSIHIETRGMPLLVPPQAALNPAGDRLYYLTRRGGDPTRRGADVVARDLPGNEAGRAAWSVPIEEANILALSPDGSTLAIGDRSGSVALIDTARGTVRDRLAPTPDDPLAADSLAFSPDGKTLAIGAREQIRLWTIERKPRPLVRLPGHRGSVRLMAFDAKGNRLAAADEKTTKVWDLVPLRAELARLGLDW